MSDNSAILKSGTLLSGAALIGGEDLEPPPDPQDRRLPLRLPSGRAVVLVMGETGEELQVVDTRGEVEVSITLSDAGPVVRLTGARLELESAEDVSVTCRDFKVAASGGLDMRAQDEIHIKSPRDVYVEGAVIWLN